jgi:hypothetical protein
LQELVWLGGLRADAEGGGHQQDVDQLVNEKLPYIERGANEIEFVQLRTICEYVMIGSQAKTPLSQGTTGAVGRPRV